MPTISTPTPPTEPPTLNSHQQLEVLDATLHSIRHVLDDVVVIQQQATREGDILLSEALKPSLQHLFELLDTYSAVGRIFMDRLGLVETRH